MIKAPQKGAFFYWMQVVYCYTPIVAVPAPFIEFMPPPSCHPEQSEGSEER